MEHDFPKHHRRSIRLAGYDYRAAGAYFVTICAHRKKCVFGRVRANAIQTNMYGQMVAQRWLDLPAHFPHLTLDEWIIMPNHFHGIVIFNDANHDARRHASGVPLHF